MPTVNLTTAKFPSSCSVPNGNSNWVLSWHDLVRAAITVGRSSTAHVIKHGPYSLMEILYRVAIVYANLREKSGGYQQTLAFKGLDPSEKAAISYFLGLAMTKSFAEHHLGVPWMMHVDVYKKPFSLKLSPGKRPDLFGMDILRRWIVAESKGRSGRHSIPALARAKAQAAQVLSIGGSAPHLSIGIVTSFGGGLLRLVAEDPPIELNGAGLRWEIQESDFLQNYYRPVRALIATLSHRRESVHGRDVDIVRLAPVDLEIGLLSELRMKSPSDEAEIAGRGLSDGQASVVSEEQGARMGADGVFVRLGPSWSDAQMRLQPQKRRYRSKR